MRKVSIISGVYNAEKYLEGCLTSLVKQTYPNIEIILINNASIDSSQVIIDSYKEKFPEKIIAIETTEKLGAGGSRAKGLEYSTGEYICFVDCDDTIDTNYISSLMKVVEQENQPDIIYCNFQKVDIKGNIKYIRKFKNINEALLQSIAPWAKIFKKDYLDYYKLTFRNVPFGEDVIFSAEVYLTRPSIALCDIVGYSWLDNPNSTSHTEIRNFPENTIGVASDYFNYMLEKYDYQEDYLSYFMTKYVVWYLLQSGRGVRISIMKQEYEKAFSFLEGIFPKWYKFNFGKLKDVKSERKEVRIALFMIRLLRRLRLSKLFFEVYTKLPMEKLWPSL